MVLLRDAEHLLHFGRDPSVRVVYLIWIKLFHLFTSDEATLVTEPLFGQILAAIVAHLFLVAPLLLFPPVFAHFLQN